MSRSSRKYMGWDPSHPLGRCTQDEEKAASMVSTGCGWLPRRAAGKKGLGFGFTTEGEVYEADEDNNEIRLPDCEIVMKSGADNESKEDERSESRIEETSRIEVAEESRSETDKRRIENFITMIKAMLGMPHIEPEGQIDVVFELLGVHEITRQEFDMIVKSVGDENLNSIKVEVIQKAFRNSPPPAGEGSDDAPK